MSAEPEAAAAIVMREPLALLERALLEVAERPQMAQALAVIALGIEASRIRALLEVDELGVGAIAGELGRLAYAVEHLPR